MDWTKSGRVDSFEFYRIDASSGISGMERRIDGVTGGRITWDGSSELKVSGILDVTKTGLLANSYVRVYYIARQGGETKRTELCTCYARTENGHYEDGTYSGTIELRGVLARHLDDELHKNYTLSKGKSALGYFRSMFKWLGGDYAIRGVKDKALAKTVVFEVGKRPMDVLEHIADFLSAEITCDSHGRTVLQPKVTPGKRPVSYVLPTGERSLTLIGIDITSTQDGTPNRVAVYHRWTAEGSGRAADRKREIVASAEVASSSAISRSKAGRYITKTFDLSDLSPKTQARANAVAKDKLRGASAYTTTYRFRTLYVPVTEGQVVEFRYDSIHCTGVFESIDLELLPGAPMTVSMRRLKGL